MVIYLQDRLYYEKIYDQQTIDECLRMEDIYKSKENSKDKKQNVYAKTAKSLMVAMKKYDRAGHRNEVITEWMKRGEDRDNHLVSVPVPQACCCNCDSINLQELSRDFMKRGNEDEKVLFMFVCDICSKRQVYWEDELLWRHEPKCIECKKSVNMNSEIKDNILVSTYKCLHCGYKDCDEMDLVVVDDDKKQKEDEKKFEKLRTKYCLSESEGEEHLRSFESLEELTSRMPSYTYIVGNIFARPFLRHIPSCSNKAKEYNVKLGVLTDFEDYNEDDLIAPKSNAVEYNDLILIAKTPYIDQDAFEEEYGFPFSDVANYPQLKESLCEHDRVLQVSFFRKSNEPINFYGRNPRVAKSSIISDSRQILVFLKNIGFNLIIATPTDVRRKRIYTKLGMTPILNSDTLFYSLKDI